ncbi:MAG: enoyl-CoA hydratase/isomerase family protein, partial [Hyphomicrobiales bacterium]
MDVEKMMDVHALAGKPEASGIAIGDAHAAGTITLSDAGSGNIPDLATYRALGPALSHWGKAPVTYCVLVRSALPGTFAVGYGPARGQMSAAIAREVFREAYAVTWALDCFIKPTIPLIDGAVSGAGVGLSLYGTHRVAGPGYRFSMPGPADGWFPDHGTAHVFSRMPDNIGIYLALTGRAIGRGDAFRLGLLTQCIDTGHFAHIARSLSDADPVDPL